MRDPRLFCVTSMLAAAMFLLTLSPSNAVTVSLSYAVDSSTHVTLDNTVTLESVGSTWDQYRVWYQIGGGTHSATSWRYVGVTSSTAPQTFDRYEGWSGYGTTVHWYDEDQGKDPQENSWGLLTNTVSFTFQGG